MDEIKDIHTKKKKTIHKGHRRKKLEVAVWNACSRSSKVQSYKTDTQCFQSKNYRCPTRVPIDAKCNCNKIFPDEKLTKKTVKWMFTQTKC